MDFTNVEEVGTGVAVADAAMPESATDNGRDEGSHLPKHKMFF